MGFLKRIFGGGEREQREYERPAGGYDDRGGRERSSTDEQALERYRYMLRTAPPETIEQAHQEAFTQLSPEQRRQVLQELSQDAPESERDQYSDDPRSLARMATRAEMRRPGTIERMFGPSRGGYGSGGMGMGGIGMGGMIGGTILGSLAAGFVGSAIANQFFDNDTGYNEGGDSGDAGYNEGDAGADGAGDSGGAETFEGDSGGDMGDFGGDVGGGDFGGGDF